MAVETLDRAGAKPAPRSSDDWPTEVAENGQFTPEIMSGVFTRLGGKPPAAIQTQVDARAKAAEEGTKTPEQLEAEAKAKAITEAESTARETAEAEAKEAGMSEADIKAAGIAAAAEARAAAQAEGKTPEELEAEADAKAAAEANKGEHGEETAEQVKTKLKDLPEETRAIVQSVIDGRIGEITAKTKAETDRLGNRVVELTTELETTRKNAGQIIQIPGIHPALLLESEEAIRAYADRLDANEDLLEPLKDTGIEADEAKGHRAYSPDEVRAQLREIKKVRERVLPQARTLLQSRAETATKLKADFPAMFDPRTEEYREADKLRKEMPELRRRPDADAVIAKIILGTKVLTKPSRKTPASDAGNRKPPIPARRASRMPGDGSPALGSPLDRPGRETSDPSAAVSTFAKTRTRADLIGAIRALSTPQ